MREAAPGSTVRLAEAPDLRPIPPSPPRRDDQTEPYYYAAGPSSPARWNNGDGRANPARERGESLPPQTESDDLPPLYHRDEHEYLVRPRTPSRWAQFSQPGQPLAPASTPFAESIPELMNTGVFGVHLNDLADQLLIESAMLRPDPMADYVLGAESRIRPAGDAGGLLRKSSSTSNVHGQMRSPVSTEPRIRGDRLGRLLASGSYWIPARQDLDTMISKIDPRILLDITVIKGPYAVDYGPGFDFIDFRLLPTPRSECGCETGGSTSLEYQFNGEQVYGRQTLWHGSETWGLRIGYGHRTGNDYVLGDSATDFDAPASLPTSYNSRDWDVALGYDLGDCDQIEFTYLRQEQTGVEYPGLVFDINSSVTNAYELRYASIDHLLYDKFTADVWYNDTRFRGDTLASGKAAQIPTLATLIGPPGLGFAITDVNSMSLGYRLAATWGDETVDKVTLGTDLIFLKQRLDDTSSPNTVFAANFPIPKSHSLDVGLFVKHEMELMPDGLVVRSGYRGDFVSTDAEDMVANFAFGPITVSNFKGVGLEQQFYLNSGHMLLDYEFTEAWTLFGGAGYAERAPTLTEMYACGSFIGSLQPGLTFLEGDPALKKEKRTQIDAGVRADYECVRAKLVGFYAWLNDYITYDNVFRIPGFVPGQAFQFAAFGNTDRAMLTGTELTGDVDLTGWLNAFAIVSYVEGRDYTRTDASRIGALRRTQVALPAQPRSMTGVGDENLPGISPFESRLGFRVHEACHDPAWGTEIEARIVADQERVAATLFEQRTGGYTLWNLRSYARLSDGFTLIGGVENLGDKFYRDHLDFRSGRGVFQPGRNAYVSGEWRY